MQEVAVVTGSAKGLGKAMVLALAKNGFTTVTHYNTSQKEAQQVLSRVKQSSAKSIAIQADLKDYIQVKKMFEKILKKFKRIDLLVNNVGNFIYKEFIKTTNDEIKDILESNVYTTLYCSREVLPQMRKSRSGQIINIGAAGCERINITEKSTPYFLAKNGVYVLTKIMAHDEAKNGIRINMISPASLATDIFKPSDFPMSRSANYEDVIKALKFLISADAYYINGANIEVAGGFIPQTL